MSIAIIQPSGILDGVSAKDLRSQVMEVLEKENAPDVVLVDLQDVTFMDSAGLGALVSILKTVRFAGAEFFLCSLSEQVKVIFELTKMERVFKIYDDRFEFEQSVKSEKNTWNQGKSKP
jgi:anti-sigma B factor antagonist